MKKIFIYFSFSLFIITTSAQNPFYMSQWSDVKGYWSFDNTSNLWFDSSSYNHPLVPVGVAPSTTSGYFSGDKAITLPTAAPTNYINCIPNLLANGGGARLNVYTIMFDIKVPSIGSWYSLLQTGTTATANDGDLFVNTSGKLGVGAVGYSAKSVSPDQWTRIVFVCDNNVTTGVWKIYIDGVLDVNASGQGIDGRFSLAINTTPFYFFADDDNENTSLTCSSIAIWDRVLSDAEVKTLGGYYVAPAVTYPIKPFLQTPTSTSIYTSWLSTQTVNTKVIYGTSKTSLNLEKTGTNETISTKIWHTVKLTNLTPNTTYYYQCISGTDSSAITPFHTAPITGTSQGHIIFGLYSDIHIGAERNATAVLTSMKNKFIELYGANWYEKISVIICNGDVFQNATIAELNTFYSTYITPVSGNVPFMCTLGNHDLYTNPPTLYYQFLKYDDFSAFPLDATLNEKYYSFVLGNTLFITLNSETTPAPSYENSTQATWLENKLIAAQSDVSIDFVFVNSHHPGKSEVWQTANDNWIQNTIYPILGKYSKVAMISHGHSHNYERGVIKSTNADNVDFRTLITGGGGGWLDFWADYTNEIDWPQTHRSLEGAHYSIIDIDMDNKSYTATMYSLGSSSASNTTTIVADTYHGIKNQISPDKPFALSPKGTSNPLPVLSASAFSGADEIMSSQFQLTLTPGNYTTPLINVTRDYENIFQSSGASAYTPIDKNAGIDLTKFQTTATLTLGTTYGWRVRYRDQNLKWSSWSDEVTFMADELSTSLPDIDENKISITPNPTSDFIMISGNTINTEIYIYDILGNKLVNKYSGNKIIESIDISAFPQGVYFISIKNKENNFTQKIIKK